MYHIYGQSRLNRISYPNVSQQPWILQSEDQACLDMACQFIHQLTVKLEQHQCELNEKKKNFSNYTNTIEQCLQTYIEQHGIYLLRLKCELKKALINNDYQQQVLELKYRQFNPDEHQVRH